MYSGQQFGEYLEERKLKNTTINAYLRDAAHFCINIEKAGIAALSEVTEKDIKNYCARVMENGVSAVSIQRKMAAIRKLFAYLQHKGDIVDNPAAAVRLPMKKRRLQRVLTHAEIEALVATPGEYTPIAQRDCAMLKLMASTGIKVSELINIRIESVVTDNQKLLLVRDGVVTGIYLDDKSYRCLWRYITSGRSQLLVDSRESALFLNSSGFGLSRQGVWKILKKHAIEAGIGDVTPEMLRRSFALRLLDTGHDLHQLKNLLGHSSLSTTKAYIQSSLEEA